MADSTTLEKVNAAFSDMREALKADGYDLVVAVAPGEAFDVEVIALEGACEECLVPKEFMEAMLSSALPTDVAGSPVQLRYPGE